MRLAPALILVVIAVGCQTTVPSTPTLSTDPGSVVDPVGQLAPTGEVLAGRFRLVLDPARLQVNVTPIVARTTGAQPPQALSYDLDIANFLAPDSLDVAGVGFDEEGDIAVNYTHRHPFPAPDLAAPISGRNRADLGYTGRLVIAADKNPTSYFDGEAIADPTLIKDADGYVAVGDLLAQTGIACDTLPYMLLTDEARDNRLNASNGGIMTGSYDAPDGGWQRGNFGVGNLGWTGYDYLHGGQQVAGTFTVQSEALATGPVEIDLAILIKYTDPRGLSGRSMRLPPSPADVSKYAYRLPYAALDASQLNVTVAAGLDDLASSTAAVNALLRDWDASATEATDAILGDESDVALVQPGASGNPVLDLDAPALSTTPFALTDGAGSGIPGDELAYSGLLVNLLGAATAGSYYGLARAIDPEDGDPAAQNYHFGVDPTTIAPDANRALAVRTYQAVTIDVAIGLLPPEVTGVTPTGVLGLPGTPVTFSATATNSPTNWSWDFDGGATPNTSTDAAPAVTLGSAATYDGTVIASNAAGSSAPFPFTFTVTPPATPGNVWTWGSTGADYAYSVAADTGGNVYVVGSFEGSVDFNPDAGVDLHTSTGFRDIFVACYTGSAFQWAQTWGSAGDDNGYAAAIAPGGGVYVSGWFLGNIDFDPGAGVDMHASNGVNDAFIARFSPSGAFQWARTFGGPSNEFAWTGASDSAGRAYVGGGYSGSVDFNPGAGTDTRVSSGTDPYILQLDSNGDYLWALTWGGTGSDQLEGIDASGFDLIAAGYYTSFTMDLDPGAGVTTVGNAGGNDVMLSRFSQSTGALIHGRVFGGGSNDFGTHATMDASGNAIISGNFASAALDFNPGAGVDTRNPVGQSDTFLNKFDAAGNQLWVRTLGSSLFDSCYTVDTDSAGNVHLTGAFAGAMDVDPGGGVDMRSPMGGSDAFLWKLDPTGNLVWARTWGSAGSGTEVVLGISVLPGGESFSCGAFQGTVDFDPSGAVFTRTASLNDAFLIKLLPTGLW